MSSAGVCLSMTDSPRGNRWWGGRYLVTRIPQHAELELLNRKTEAKYYAHFLFMITTFYCYNKK